MATAPYLLSRNKGSGVIDPATIMGGLVAYFAAHWMDNVIAAEINNLGHHVVRRTFHAINGDTDERANHDIARTVRLAQIAALEMVLDGYARLNAGAWAHNSSAPAAFLDAAALFCREQRRLAKSNPAALAIAALEPLQATVDGALAPAVEGSPARAYADAVGDLAEQAVLDELRQYMSVAVPADFDGYLKHGAKGDHPRFLAGFADEIREAVKSNPRNRGKSPGTQVQQNKGRSWRPTLQV